MSIRENAQQVGDFIKVWHILVSTYYKDGLDDLVRSIIEVNPDAMFYSSTGTGRRIKEILESISGADPAKNYMSVEDFTGAPEMDGGLVKTLHPKIHAGLLGERGNPEHETYIYNTLADPKHGGNGKPGVFFDAFVGNLYPFEEVVADEKTTPETARVNIDIGGPTMTEASAKNWPSVAVLTSPRQYPSFMELINRTGGTHLEARFMFAQEALNRVAKYRSANAEYFDSLNFAIDVLPTLNIAGRGQVDAK